MASFDDIIASVLDAKNVGKDKYVPQPRKPVLTDPILPFEKYDDTSTARQRMRDGARQIPDNKLYKDRIIPPPDEEDNNAIDPNEKPLIQYRDNEYLKGNEKFRKYRKA